MSPLQLYLIITFLKTVDSNCSITSWPSLTEDGLSQCDVKGEKYIKGFNFTGSITMDNLVKLECCNAPPQWSNSDEIVAYVNWPTGVYGTQWFGCPHGYFLQGFYRMIKRVTQKGWFDYFYSFVHTETEPNVFQGIKCARKAKQQIKREGCYEIDFNKIKYSNNKMRSCKEGDLITSLQISHCSYTNCIHQIYCCRMAQEPSAITDIGEIKTLVIETNLRSILNLAHRLGFDYCYGCRTTHIGEDYLRDGYNWVADINVFPSQENCDETNIRTKLTYGNWSFAVKNITYGEITIDDLETETLNIGKTINEDTTSTVGDIKIEKVITDTLTNTLSGSNKFVNDLGISLDISFPKLPSLGGVKPSFTFNYETSSNKSNRTSAEIKKSFAFFGKKNVNPCYESNYRAVLSKIRVTLPYAATVIVKFSTEINGYLRWGGGFFQPTTNYHVTHTGSDQRPIFTYRIGDENKAFYSALQEESDSQLKPWLWNELLMNYPNVQEIIKRLTDERRYEFTLNGFAEYITGTHIEVFWEKDTKIEQSPKVNDTKPSIADIVHPTNNANTAKVDPDDKRANVTYPNVTLLNEDTYQLQLIPVNNSLA